MHCQNPTSSAATVTGGKQVRRYVSIVLLIALYMLCKISLKQSVWNGVESVMLKKYTWRDIQKRGFEKTGGERNYEPGLEYKGRQDPAVHKDATTIYI